MRNGADVGGSRKNVSALPLHLVVVVDELDELILFFLSDEMALGSLHVVLLQRLIEWVARIVGNHFAEVVSFLSH